MRNTARLADAFRGRTERLGAAARSLADFRGHGTVRRRAEAAALVGAGLAMVGVGTASAATIASPAATHAVSAHVAHAAAKPGRDKVTTLAKPAAAPAKPAARSSNTQAASRSL